MIGLKAVGHSIWTGLGLREMVLIFGPAWIGLGLRKFASLVIQIFFGIILRFSKSVLCFSESLWSALVSSDGWSFHCRVHWICLIEPMRLRYCAELQKLSAVGRRIRILAMQRCGFGIRSSGWLVAGTGSTNVRTRAAGWSENLLSLRPHEQADGTARTSTEQPPGSWRRVRRESSPGDL